MTIHVPISSWYTYVCVVIKCVNKEHEYKQNSLRSVKHKILTEKTFSSIIHIQTRSQQSPTSYYYGNS